MSEKTEEIIFKEVLNHIISNMNNNDKYSNFYCGIINSGPSIFSKFNISKSEGVWIFRTAENNELAKNVIKRLIENGVDFDRQYEIIANRQEFKVVFAFRKSIETLPKLDEKN